MVVAPAGDDVVFHAQPGLAALKEFAAGLWVVLVSLGLYIWWEATWLAILLLVGVAVVLLGDAAYDRRWSLTLSMHGIALRRLGPTKTIAWSDVGRVRVEPSWSHRGQVVSIGSRPGSLAPEIRFQYSRLDGADRRRLFDLLAARGHASQPTEA